jgi:hypothetical protein
MLEGSLGGIVASAYHVGFRGRRVSAKAVNSSPLFQPHRGCGFATISRPRPRSAAQFNVLNMPGVTPGHAARNGALSQP